MKTLFSLCLLLGLVSIAHAAPGDLDTTFSTDGKVVTDVPGTGGGNAVVIQADGKIVVAGSANGDANRDFAVVRYNRNGSLDTTFGGDGIVTTDLGGQIDSARAIAIQADGRIVVAGTSGVALDPVFALVRYNTNGTLDTTFSGDGQLRMEFTSSGAGGGGAADVAIQADGRIVVVGTTGSDFAVARFNPNGTLDTTFGLAGTGIVIANLGSADDTATAVAIQADGRIVVAGFRTVDGRRVFAVERISTTGLQEFLGVGLPEGANATAFGPAINVSASATDMVLQADGKIVVVGDVIQTFPGSTQVIRAIGIARYNTNGTLDTTFATTGLRTLTFGNPSVARGVAIQPDDKIVVVGNTQPSVNGSPNPNFAVARFNVNGLLDATFSGDGLLTTDFQIGSPSRDFGSAVAIQRTDGRIVVAGEVNGSVAVARYHAFACNGADVTIVGTNGPDTIFGAVSPLSIFIGLNDVIHGLGGNDIIDGGGGDDIICGGDGNDTLRGGTGQDVLVAGTGRDSLDGGPGTNDVCVGSSSLNLFTDPVDSFVACETINTGRAGVSGEWVGDVTQSCNQSVRNPACSLRGKLRVFNPGEEATAVPSQVAFYLSEDEVLDENDVFLTTAKVRAQDPGDDQLVNLNIKLPVGDAAGAFVIAVVDYLNDVPERNEDNNIAVSPPVTAR
jgi:uncharacterized delta-60 repeat protein